MTEIRRYPTNTPIPIGNQCQACASIGMEEFYYLPAVPVHSVVVLREREAGLNFPSGSIRLAMCRQCGFISNVDFDEAQMDYAAEYESTQSYSPTFDQFSRQLAQDLIERYNLRGKTLLEIGCGMGEFLLLICELGDNQGFGFDPAYRPGRVEDRRVQIHASYFDEQTSLPPVDAVICKMTLEHIPHPRRFVEMVRQNIPPGSRPLVFFQVPALEHIDSQAAFWDIYYEHCSYFSQNALQELFTSLGFEILRSQHAYDGQYFLLETRLPAEPNSPPVKSPSKIVSPAGLRMRLTENVARWQARLEAWSAEGRQVVLWGGGSKAVAFLSAMRHAGCIRYCVDVNPHKWNTYLPGSGAIVLSPGELSNLRPDIVVVMNPIYQEEIQQWLNSMQLNPQVYSLVSLVAEQNAA